MQSWLWLQAGLGYGAQNTADLLQAFPGGAPEIARHLADLPLSGLVTEGQAARLANSHPQEFAPLLQKLNETGVRPLPYNDPDYPELLRNIYNPPIVLYAVGDVSLLDGRLCIGMVGTRRPSPYGVDAMKRLAGDVAAAGAVVVSGLATGLDAQAHKAALAANGATVACLAFGHNHCYPAANRSLLEVIQRHGLALSEYPPDVHADRHFFLQRNRIIAGLSQGLLVAQARSHSGTMSTVAFAQAYGRDVFAVPGDIFSEMSSGANNMIREGAYLAAEAEDILSVYGVEVAETPAAPKGAAPPLHLPPKPWEQPAAPAQAPARPAAQAPAKKPEPAAQSRMPDPQAVLPTMGTAARALYACLGTQPVSLGVLCETSGLAPGAVMAALTELELAGLSRQLAGRRFVAAQ